MFNPGQMKKLMKQMNMTEIPAEKVIIISEGKKLVIDEPQVTKMNVMGQSMLQIQGELREEKDEKIEISEEDIELVIEKTGCSKEDAKKALEESNGDLVEAIESFKR